MAAKSRKKSSATVWGWTAESLLKAHLQSDRKDGQKAARVHVQISKKSQPATRTVEREDGLEIFINPLAATEMEGDSRLKTNAAVRVRDAVGASLGVLEK